MGDRFYQQQIAYHKVANKELRAEGTKEQILARIMKLDSSQDVVQLKKLLKQSLVDFYYNLEEEINDMSTWTDELKAAVIKEYQDAKPTPETSTELLKEIAEKYEVTPNGVRMVLTKAEVYVKKAPATSATKATASGEAPKRVSKESQISALKSAITDAGGTIDDEIIDKLTGKAAAYFLTVVQAKA